MDRLPGACRITPHMVAAAGIGVRVQGMRRYYGLLLVREGKVRLVKVLDGERVLAEADCRGSSTGHYEPRLSAKGNRLQAWVDGQKLFEVEDGDRPLTGGAVALICEEGHMSCGPVTAAPPDER